MATSIDQLTQDVAAENTVTQSLIQLLNNISAQLKAAGTDPVALKALDDSINANKAAIVQAIQQNTPQSPVIQSLLPNSGPVGTQVIITGTGFGNTQSASKISFNGVDAGIADNWTDTQISVKVPSGASTGDVLVVSNIGGSSARGTTFSVDAPVQAAPTETAPGSGVTTPAVGTQEPNPSNPASTAVPSNPNPNTTPGTPTP